MSDLVATVVRAGESSGATAGDASGPETITASFLFTDIEGSTRLLQAHPDAYRAAVRRHHDLLQEAIEAEGGVVFETVGDAVYASFAAPHAAVAAAIAGQRALLREPWGELDSIKVRMGVHQGEVEPQGSHYFGAPLYRCARLMATAHGGQIVLSSVVATALAGSALPAGASLRDLGEHRLKDLSDPEQIFQVVQAELPSAFPPLRSLEPRPHNLPVPTTHFVGRTKQLVEVQQLLRDPRVRVLTLSGPGGTGKTRLALQTAHYVLDDFQHGVWFVDLAPIADPALVPSVIAQVLGIQAEGGHSPLEALGAFLRDRQLLLVLDNVEQIVDAAPAVAELLRGSPGLKVLATTRILLRISGEHDYPVPPLTLPNLRALPPPAQLLRFEAVRLFVERAAAAKPDFTLSAENASAVSEICLRLDGLPLAIELAAARVRLFAPGVLLRRLEHRLSLLTGGPRDVPARQQTLRNAIAWSYDLLSPEEQALLRRLAPFSGGGTLEAVEAICGGDLGSDVFEGLVSLSEQSLLRLSVDTVAAERAGEGGDAPVDDTPRFSVLETIREFAAEQLASASEAVALGRKHATYYLDFAVEADERLRGPQQVEWFRRLDRDHDNLRAALSWAAGAPDDEMGLQLATTLTWYWSGRGHFAEGRRWLATFLNRANAVPPALTAKGSLCAAMLAVEHGDFKAAQSYAQASLNVQRQLGDQVGAGVSLSVLGNASRGLGDMATARTYYEQSLSLRRELGDVRGVGYALRNLGACALAQGDYELGQRQFAESASIFRRLGDRLHMATCLYDLGKVAIAQREYTAARGQLEEALAILREVGDPNEIARCLVELGWARLGHMDGDVDGAETAAGEALDRFRDVDSRHGQAIALHILGCVAQRRNDLDTARTKLEESRALFHALDDLQQCAVVEAALASCTAEG